MKHIVVLLPMTTAPGDVKGGYNKHSAVHCCLSKFT